MIKKKRAFSRCFGVFFVAVLGIVMIGGCGGSGDGGTTGATTSSTSAGNEASTPAGNEASTSTGSEAPAPAGPAGGEGARAGGEKSDAETAYIEEADAICAKAGAQIEKGIRAYFTSIESLKKNAGKIAQEVIAPGLEKEIQDILALEAPDEAKEAEETLIAGLESMAAGAKKSPEAFILSPTAASESEKAAKEAGFSSCGALV